MVQRVATVAFEGIEARRRCQVQTRPSFVNDKAWFPEGNFRCARLSRSAAISGEPMEDLCGQASMMHCAKSVPHPSPPPSSECFG